MLESPDDILCVVDDPQTQEGIGAALADLTVTYAGDAFEALRAMNAQVFHAYIVDRSLPDWDGLQLCREIRERDPHAPLLFCSEGDIEQERAKAWGAGANLYFSKPVDFNRLRRQLHAQLRLCDLQSLRAREEEERVIGEELQRRLREVLDSTAAADTLARTSMERTARTKAFRAFMEARGTRAAFERWWPAVFDGACSGTAFETEPAVRRPKEIDR